MSHKKINTYESPESTARAVADLITSMALDKSSQNKYLNIAVSGGSTPKLLFSLLTEEYANDVPWKSVKLFWVDERCVPPTHPDSNFGMTYDAMLRMPMIPGENVFRMRGEDFPEDEAIRYQKKLWEQLTVQNAYPVFDLILLGMGDDGHTASIFPDQMHLLDVEPAVAVAVHPQSGQKRITLTGNTIKNAQKVDFLITGKGKAEVLQHIFSGEKVAEKYPASHVWASNGIADFYLDNEAAALL